MHAFFSGWAGPAQIVLVGVLAYVALILFLRLFGKRTLAKMNAFGLVVTVALGSALSSVLLTRSVPLLDGVVAFLLLLGLQFVVAWVSLRARWFRSLVKSDPALLVRDGVFQDEIMRHERVDRDEVLAAIRQNGIVPIHDVGAVVLETDGSLSVLRRHDGPVGASSLADVPGAEPRVDRG